MYYLYVVLFLLNTEPQARLWNMNSSAECESAAVVHRQHYDQKNYRAYTVDKNLGNRYIVECLTEQQLQNIGAHIVIKE